MDASGVSEHMLKPYVGSEAVDISTTNHTFVKRGIRNLIVTATGNVQVTMLDGSTPTIPVAVTTNGHSLLFTDGKGGIILGVVKVGTSATVTYGLY